MENCLIFQRATLISEWMAWVFRCVPKKFPMPKFVHSNKSATDSEASRWSRSSPNARDWIFNNIKPFWCDRFRADCYPFGIRSSVTFSLAPYSIYHSAIGYIFRLLCLCVQFFLLLLFFQYFENCAWFSCAHIHISLLHTMICAFYRTMLSNKIWRAMQEIPLQKDIPYSYNHIQCMRMSQISQLFQ